MMMVRWISHKNRLSYHPRLQLNETTWRANSLWVNIFDHQKLPHRLKDAYDFLLDVTDRYRLKSALRIDIKGFGQQKQCHVFYVSVAAFMSILFICLRI